MIRLLVTGVSGLLGSNLALHAVRDHTVVGLYHSHPVTLSGCETLGCDLTDRVLTTRCLDDIRPDVIVHCAAITDVERCEADPESAQQINVEATRVLADWAGRHGVKMVYVSTDAVFDGERGHYRERDTPRPVNQYARTKLAGEEVIRDRLPDALVVRTNLYGWNVSDKLSFGEWVLRALIQRSPLTMFTDVIFNPLLTNDLAQIIMDLLDRGAEGTYHIGARDVCSKHRFALWLADIFDLCIDTVIPVSVDRFSFQASRPKYTSLAVERISQFLGQEMPSVIEGLNKFKSLLDDGYVVRLKGQQPIWLTRAIEA